MRQSWEWKKRKEAEENGEMDSQKEKQEKGLRKIREEDECIEVKGGGVEGRGNSSCTLYANHVGKTYYVRAMR